jgi:hypothetical protein
MKPGLKLVAILGGAVVGLGGIVWAVLRGRTSSSGAPPPSSGKPPPSSGKPPSTAYAARRQQIVDRARAEIGSSDASSYWLEVLGTPGPYPPHWCGAFVLWVYRTAGLVDWQWSFDKTKPGFLYRLQSTTDPQPGDAAYYANLQHHALVASVDRAKGTIKTIDGNQPDVREVTRPLSAASAYYSIEPLLASS